MKHGSCFGCGKTVRYFSVRVCIPCLAEMVDKLPLCPVDPYAAPLLPPGKSYYPVRPVEHERTVWRLRTVA